MISQGPFPLQGFLNTHYTSKVYSIKTKGKGNYFLTGNL